MYWPWTIGAFRQWDDIHCGAPDPHVVDLESITMFVFDRLFTVTFVCDNPGGVPIPRDT